jgi:hypothetical protein
MDPEQLKSNWALVVAAGLGLAILVIVVAQLVRRSAAWQLRAAVKELGKSRLAETRAIKSVQKAESRARRLHANAENTKPRILRQAEEAVEDARALAKIANDRMLVAQNHVRRVIHDEYPPTQQEKLRQKFLPVEERDSKPFSF